MDFIDLKAPQKRIKQTLDANIQKVLAHGSYIMGPEVKELEGKLAAYAGVKHAIGCASGTDALMMALMALDVGPGDAVFTSPFTFFSTAEVIALLGATPVFVDIDAKTYNIDPHKLDLAVDAVRKGDRTLYPIPDSRGQYTAPNGKLTPKAMIPVDIFGLPADYDAILTIASRHGLAVIEDAAQSFGGEYKGRKTCTFGEIACTSFFPAKPIGCYGDGGMCFTDDDRLAALMRSLRVHGQGNDKYENIRIGINGRLDTLQAAILLAKFDIFPEEIELRQEAAGRYASLLKSDAAPITPHVPDGYKSAWAQYSVLAKDSEHRAFLQKRLKDTDIPTAIYYPKPLHLQTAFVGLGYKPGAFPVSEDVATRIFSLPMHPYLTESDQRKIASSLTAGGVS
jgi:dTDP-4-amino-4,6-dideoxygalactose transaminase